MGKRKFEDHESVRERLPMLVGLMGASGSGKTYSALRLATGMQRVTGGDIFYVDTESRRALHYADEFKFRHVPMDAPFSPLDYLEAIEYCKGRGASILIVDSMSHEHEGPGGVLEWQEAEMERMAGSDYRKRERVKFAAWIKPKAARRRLINEVLRMGVNAIFCFRAKEKIKIKKGEDPTTLGWMPIAGEEFVFEMTINCLLYPHSGGVPTWETQEVGERVMLKKPKNLAHVFQDGQPLSEETGEKLAKWASGEGGKEKPSGTAKKPKTGDRVDKLIERLRESECIEELESRVSAAREMDWTEDEKTQIRAAIAGVRSYVERKGAES